MQPIPIDTKSFEKMCTAREPMLYVDKTAYLHRLVTDSRSRNFFLARPRRFGKSLMTTSSCVSCGKRLQETGIQV